MERKENLRNKEVRQNRETATNKAVVTDYVDTFSSKYDKQKKAFTSIIEKQSNAINSEDSTTPQKAISAITSLTEGGIAAYSAVAGFKNQLSEGVMLPILKRMNFLKGKACLSVCKQMDPVMNLLDIHLVTIPPSPAPVPLPHPFIGFSFRAKDFLALAVMTATVKAEQFAKDKMDEWGSAGKISQANTELAKGVVGVASSVAQIFISNLGATVKLGMILPRTVAGTSTKNVFHIPMGAGFYPPAAAAIKKNHGHAWLGSLFVVADGYPLVGQLAHLHNVCSDVGVPSIHDIKGNPNVEKGFQAKLYLPIGIIASIPSGRSVLTNPVPSPINPLHGPKLLMRAGFNKLKGKLVNKVQKNISEGKACSRISSSLNKYNEKIFNRKIVRGVYRKTDKLLKTYVGHPVDVATGDLFTDSTDFSFSGPIALSFDRVWYSSSQYEGPLGHGWHHSLDMALYLDKNQRAAQVRIQDGRILNFDKIPTREHPTPRYHRSDKLWLCYHPDGYYYLKDQSGLMYLFNAPCCRNRADAYLLAAIANVDGFAIRLKYNSNGVLQEIKDSVGRLFKVQSDKQGRILKILTAHPQAHLPEVCLASYSYNGSGDLTAHYDQINQPMHIEYKNHLIVKEKWRNGHQWYFKYDGNKTGAKCIETWGDGNILHYKLRYYPGETIAVDGLGHQTIYKHRNDLVYQTTDAVGGVWSEYLNKYDELERSCDPLGHERTLLRDELGNITKVILPDGQFTQLKYNDVEFPYLPSVVIDARGGKWNYKYNKQGRLREMLNPLGAKTNFGYTQEGLPAFIHYGSGSKVMMDYDGAYNLQRLSSDTGELTQYAYDNWGRCTHITNGKGVLQTRSLDGLGRPITINDFDGNIMNLKYDALDNVTYYEDSNRAVSFTYRGMSRMTSRSELGKMIRYQYDSQQQLRTITDESGNTYEYELDGVGNVITERSFDGLTRNYKRNLAGWVTEIKRPGGRSTQYQHDEMGRAIEVNYSDKTFEKYDYEKGLLTQATNDSGKLSFQYDVLGNVLEEAFNGQQITSTYDAYGRRTELNSSLGAHLEQTYDQWSNVIEMQLNNWKTQMEYDKFGMEHSRQYAGGIKQEWEYDKLGRLKNQRVEKGREQGFGITQLFRQYTWDQGGLLRQITDNKAGNTYFEHDQRGFLKRTTYSNGEQQQRGVDAIGNLYEQLDLKDRKYKINRLEETKTEKFKYDCEGFLIEKTDKRTHQKWVYQWSGSGMLVQVIRPDRASVNFAYDALGRRVSKRYKSTTTHYLWDGNVPLHEYKTFDAREATAGDIITWVFEEGNFSPMAKIKGEKKYSIVTDHLGTPIQGFSQSGDKVWERELDSFGKVKANFGEDGFCNYLYQGQTYDKETGLCYNRFRYYDPDSGNYISQDPIGLEGGNPTLYGYVADTNGEVDVFGLLSKEELAQVQKMGADAEIIAQKEFGFSKNTETIRSIKRGKNHIPDGMTATKIYEVKCVAKQGYTRQIKSYVKTGKEVILIVDNKTVLSKPLQKAIKADVIELKKTDLKYKPKGCSGS